MKHFIILCLILSVTVAYQNQDVARDDYYASGKNVYKRAVGAIIAGAQLGVVILKNTLTAIGSASRKIAIGVANESGGSWTAMNVYFAYGSSDITLPYTVDNTEALLYSARKSIGPLSSGTAGVFTYSMSDGNYTLAVMFRVPYNKVVYSNWWNVRIYSGRQRANRAMWRELLRSSGNPLSANQWHSKDLGHGLSVRGFMTSAREATLEIHVTRDD